MSWPLGLVTDGLSPSNTGSSSLPVSPLSQGDTFTQSQGTSRQYLVTLVDPQSGAAVNPSAYASGNALQCYIWAGAAGPQLAAPTVAWASPSAGTITLEVDASHLAGLAIQPYPIRIEVQLASGAWQTAWEGWVDVDYEPGSSSAPTAPGTYVDMVKFGGTQIKQLLTEDSQAGFLEERAEAWLWLRQIILAKYRPIGGGHGGVQYFTGLPGYWVSPDYPNPIIAGYLDAGKLLITDQIGELLARKALAVLFDRQSDDKWQFAARREHRRSDILVQSLVAGIDLVGSGYPTITINCGIINTRDI